MKKPSCLIVAVSLLFSSLPPAALAGPTQEPFKRVVIELIAKSGGREGLANSRLLLVDRVGSRVKMTKCIGREYNFRNCEEFGASGGYDESEFRQIGKILKRKALVYQLLKATPATICGALLGGGLSLASVGISALGLVEIGAALNSTGVQLAAIVPLYLSVLMGGAGALAGAAMTIDHLDKIFKDENVIVAPNNILRSSYEPQYPYYTSRNLDGFEDVEQIGQAQQVVENPDLVLAHLEQHIRVAGRLYSEGTLVRVSK